ncbi:MAG: hypothetical protein B6244_03240 [Candidatus Cloacimonetes bacterium 4572_55]|nr:MAG: hypothetical protein B6244_03240 [Candidatus Cloacimonetes bacterium 4572_55]
MKLNHENWKIVTIHEIAQEIKDKVTSMEGFEKERFIRPEDLLVEDFFCKKFQVNRRSQLW